MRLLPPAAKVLAAAALPFALVACSSTTAAAPAAAPADTAVAPAPSAPAAQTSADPDAGLLTGTKLKAALAPASYFPAGFAINAADARDTGDTYMAPASADVPKADCAKLDGSAWIEITGLTGVSFAQNYYVNKNTSAELDQELDVFQGTTAQTVLGALGKISMVCKSFTDPQTKGKVTVTEKPTTGLGDEAVTISLTSPAWVGGTTLIAARTGTTVVSVLASADNAATGAASAKKLAEKILSNLKSQA